MFGNLEGGYIAPSRHDAVAKPSWTKLFHMDLMLAGEDQSQADQPNSPAEGPPVEFKLPA
eukprot:1161942-Pelagomonas_calceolata.AAC.7